MGGRSALDSVRSKPNLNLSRVPVLIKFRDLF